MDFSPANPIARLCLEGMEMEQKGRNEDALAGFLEAWQQSSNDFEKFLAAYFIARRQDAAAGKLKWLDTALQLALKLNDDAVNAALPALYTAMADCHSVLGDENAAKECRASAASVAETPAAKGPFYHGTKADLKPGDLLTPGFNSNYKSGLNMNHIYFTALVNGAGLAAALAAGNGPDRVYVVEPTGQFENDPNLTNKKFPGNPTRSYRTVSPLKVVDEVKEWVRLTPEELESFRKKLSANKGEIIN